MDYAGQRIREVKNQGGASPCPPGSKLMYYGQPGVWQSETPTCGRKVNIPAPGAPGTHQYAQDQMLKGYVNKRGMDTHPAVRDAVRGRVDPSAHRGRPLWQR